MARCQKSFEGLRRLGVNVLIPEYPGYGMSDGRASERGCYAAADVAYDYLARRPDIDRAQIIVAGHSLGGAVAVDLASRRHVAALITLSTFTSKHNQRAQRIQERMQAQRQVLLNLKDVDIVSAIRAQKRALELDLQVHKLTL